MHVHARVWNRHAGVLIVMYECVNACGIQQNLSFIDREISAIKIIINDEDVTWEVFSISNYRFQTRGLIFFF